MIPIKLEIEGLYSYRKKQTIHFDKLTDAGLFGIFGAVGSGKSSILEGILLALYGSSERLSDRGEKSSLLNLRSSSLSVRLTFKAGRSNVQEYVAIYQLNRHSSKPDQVGTATHQFYQNTEEGLLPIEEKAIEILGMKKEHFKQTVIIPQGKFREFVDLTPGPRAEMMKELFGLERFDLSAKANLLSKASKEEQIKITTRIEALGEADESIIKTLVANLEELKKQRDAIHKTLKLDEETFKKAEGLLVKYQERERLTASLVNLNAEKPEIEKSKERLKSFLKASTLLKPILDNIQDRELEKEKLTVEVESCKRFKGTYADDVDQLVKEVEILQEKADNRHLREAKIKDLEKVLEIQALLEQLKKLDATLRSLAPKMNELSKRKALLAEKIASEEQSLDQMEEVDPGSLAQLQSSWKEWEALDNRLTNYGREINELGTKIEREKVALSQVQENLESSSIEEEIKKAKQTIKLLERSWEEWMGKKGLVDHAHLLVKGAPCPLCGAEHHPSPLQSGQIEKEDELKSRIKSAQHTLDQLHSLEKEIQRQTHQISGLEQILKREQAQISATERELEVLKRELAKEDIHQKESLSMALTTKAGALEKKKKLELALKQWRRELKEVEADLDTKSRELQEYENRKSTIQSSIAAKQGEIVDMEFCHAYFDKDSSEIKNEIEAVKNNIAVIAEKLTSKRRVLDDLKRKATANLTQLEGYQKRLEECEESLGRLRQELSGKMGEHGFESEEGLLELFNRPLDVEKTEKEIRKFEDRYLLLSTQLEKLDRESDLVGFKEEYYREAKEKLESSKSTLEAKDREATLLQKSISEQQERLLIKNDLEQQLQKVEQRLSIVSDLQRLFSGNGFVKYVSTIYLKELCATANQRFMRLTKNQLSLDIDDQNTFWIIDYLNGGKRRLLRTLSGGQTFQASLCLALALAEKVKSLNQADQSFFFLDEGFGALDKNSLRVVFETLKSLRHENRIVGIISHVEELQQEIGVYAQVDLDPEVGSVVSYSF
jgi:DNA repair protein SbcC/Rad50